MFWEEYIKFTFCRIKSKNVLTFLKSKNDARCFKNEENSEYLKIQYFGKKVLNT